jgi:hypothetical protein
MLCVRVVQYTPCVNLVCENQSAIIKKMGRNPVLPGRLYINFNAPHRIIAIL